MKTKIKPALAIVGALLSYYCIFLVLKIDVILLVHLSSVIAVVGITFFQLLLRFDAEIFACFKAAFSASIMRPSPCVRYAIISRVGRSLTYKSAVLCCVPYLLFTMRSVGHGPEALGVACAGFVALIFYTVLVAELYFDSLSYLFASDVKSNM